MNEEYLNEDDDNANGQNFGYKEYDSDDDDLGGPKLEKKRKWCGGIIFFTSSFKYFIIKIYELEIPFYRYKSRLRI